MTDDIFKQLVLFLEQQPKQSASFAQVTAAIGFEVAGVLATLKLSNCLNISESDETITLTTTGAIDPRLLMLNSAGAGRDTLSMAIGSMLAASLTIRELSQIAFLLASRGPAPFLSLLHKPAPAPTKPKKSR